MNNINEILSLPFESEKEKKKIFTQIHRYLKNKIQKFKKISDYNKRKAYMLLFSAFNKLKFNEITLNHINLIKQVIEEIESSNNTDYDLYKIDKTLFHNNENLFINKEYSLKAEQQLFIVRKDLQCLKCNHIGAIKHMGKWNPRLKDMSYAVGFGGTIPYECTNCNNIGLDNIALEGYNVTFSQIKKNQD